jgi:ADP-heptose:LPS heptosyltransferase
LEGIPKILIIRFSSFGDIVLTFPFLNELRRLYPDAQIDFIMKPQYAELVKLHPAVDNYFEYSDYTKMLLNQTNYDAVFNLQGNPKSMRISAHTGKSVYRVKKDTLKKLILVNFKINKLQDFLPVYAKYLVTLREFNPDVRISYSVTENLKIDTQNITSGEYVIVSPSSKHFTKRLPADKFIDILKSLKSKIVLTGDKSKTDNDICSYIKNNTGNTENLCGKLSFSELAAYIRDSKFLLCNDSGVLHLGEALNKKVFVFYGSTVKEFGFYPQLRTTEIFDSGELYCRPCSHIGKNKCIKGHFKCMNDIDIEAVKKRINKFENENIS